MRDDDGRAASGAAGVATAGAGGDRAGAGRAAGWSGAWTGDPTGDKVADPTDDDWPADNSPAADTPRPLPPAKPPPTPGTDAEFTAFVTAHGTRLLRLAELMCGDPHRAADLTQTALERAYLRWHRIESGDPLAYVRRIILNSYRDWWRRRRGREVSTDTLPESAVPWDAAERHAQQADVRAALASLTRRERQVVVLRYYADLSEAEIAAELGIAAGTVKSSMSRALARLRTLPEFNGRGTAPARNEEGAQSDE